MRQGTNPHRGQDWMDEERVFQARHDLSEVHVSTDPVVRLMKARGDVLDNRIAQLWAVGRAPRVCLYALATGCQEPTHSLEWARQFVLRKGWQTGTGQAVSDRHGATDPSDTRWLVLRAPADPVRIR